MTNRPQTGISRSSQETPRLEPAKIYETIRQQIIWLALPPETVLNLGDLAQSFSVSRTPIKEALILLQAEGLILSHGTNFMVTPLSLDRIKEITEIRTILEVQANVLALKRITPRELVDLSMLKKDILKVGDRTSNKQLVELDVRFHHTIFQAAKNSQLTQLLDRLLSHYLRFWLSIHREISAQAFFTEAIAIIKAIEGQDEFSLRTLSELHIKKSVEEIMKTF